MRNEHLPIVATFLAFVFGISLLNLLTPSQEVSALERRDLAQFPEISFERILDGSFTSDYAAYLQDQAAFRDEIRFVKSFVERQLFRKAENNGVYVIDGRIYDKFYGIEYRMSVNAAERINEIIPQTGVPEAYVSIIPTKAQGLDRDHYLASDQNEIARVFEEMVDATYIDIMDLATGDTALYYATDPHWTTGGAIDAYETIARSMGFEPVTAYEFEPAFDDYTGSEYGKAAAWSVRTDTIHLAHNEILDGMELCRFKDIDTWDCFDSVYVEPESEADDLYDVFLGGLSPLIVITNVQAAEGGHLVIFKDSYAHAIAPFLAQHFEQVTLVDFRYVSREYVLEHVDFDGATTLFLYSTSVINTDHSVVG